jgi:hypothetical protein
VEQALSPANRSFCGFQHTHGLRLVRMVVWFQFFRLVRMIVSMLMLVFMFVFVDMIVFMSVCGLVVRVLVCMGMCVFVFAFH